MLHFNSFWPTLACTTPKGLYLLYQSLHTLMWWLLYSYHANSYEYRFPQSYVNFKVALTCALSEYSLWEFCLAWRHLHTLRTLCAINPQAERIYSSCPQVWEVYAWCTRCVIILGGPKSNKSTLRLYSKTHKSILFLLVCTKYGKKPLSMLP